MAKDKPATAPAWYLCEFRGNVSRTILAASEEEAKAKYWRSVGVLGSVHSIRLTQLSDYKPTAEDLEIEARLNAAQ